MLEKGSWSHTPKCVFSCDGDPCNEVERLASDDAGMPDHCFKSSNIYSGDSDLCADDTILGDTCGVKDNGVFHYPINHISQADNELSFLDSDWLDIGNFEDVDRMLSCDLTFGMGSDNNEEEFRWFSSSHDVEGSDDALTSNFKFSCAEMSPLKGISDYNMDSEENCEGLPMKDSEEKTFTADEKVRSHMEVYDCGVPSPLSMFSDSDMKSCNTVDLVPKEKLQRRLPMPSTGRWKNGYLENGDSGHPYIPLEQHVDIKQLFAASSSGVTSLDSIQKQIPSMHPHFSHAPNHTSVCPMLSGSRSEPNGHLSPSIKESSHTSKLESSHGHSLEAAALKINDKIEKLYNCHDGHLLGRSLKNGKMENQIAFLSPGSDQQVGHQFENENERQSAVCGVKLGFSPEIESPNVQVSSSMCSALDHMSLEATTFCELQQTMDQVDIRTKLCIRDSLYRLAKSAEQRHDDSNVHCCAGNDVESCKAMMVHDGSRCTGIMDVETDTNPIDRSIAHLLFHKPSDPSMLLPDNTKPFKSSTMVHGSLINTPVKTEKQVCQKDFSTGVKKSL